MSLYSSQSSYGQSSYSQYSQPTAPGGYYHQYHHQPPPPMPPPPSVYQLDPVTFRRDYTNRLNELTFNSRPIIQGLSMLAQDYSRFAEIVAQCLEAHIRRVSVLSHDCGFACGDFVRSTYITCNFIIMYRSRSCTLSLKTSKSLATRVRHYLEKKNSFSCSHPFLVYPADC